MDFNYTKIKIGNFLYKFCFPLYNITYARFKNRNDKDEIDLLRQLIRPGDHILDIGSNIGFYARLLSRFTGPQGRVYCFEPDSTNFRYLGRNTAGIPNIVLFNKAVSDKAGILKVYKSKLLNVDHRTYPVNNYDSVEEIGAVSVDELLATKAIERVNLIKIDIQGYELTAFRGMTALLESSSDLSIITEYWPHGFRRAGTSAIEFHDFFAALGYGFYHIHGSKLEKISRDYIVQNNEQPFEFSFNVLIRKKDLEKI